MSTTALDVDSRERAPPSEQGGFDLAREPHLGQEKPTATSASTLAAPAAEQLQHQRVEQALRQNEAYLAEAQRLTHTGSWAWSPDQDIRYWSEECYRVLSFDPRHGLPRFEDFFQRLHPDDQPGFRELIQKVIREKAEWETDYRIVHPDGSCRDIHVVAHPVLSTSGHLVEFVGTVIDVTERRRAEQALRQSEAYLAEAQRLTHTGSWAFNPVTGKVTYWSDEMFRINGMAVRNTPPTYEEQVRLTHPEDRVRTRETFEIAIRDKADMALDYRKLMADGTVRYHLSIGHPVLDKTGAVVEYVGTVVDVTERKHAEQRLLVQYRVTRILADAATVAEATPKILQAMCECLGWDLGAAWHVDSKARVIRCVDVWRTSSVEAAQFEVVTRNRTFRSGSGLPGRVWETGAPAYTPDTGHDEVFRGVDIAAREVLRAAIAFPIMLGRDVKGVIGFINRDASPPDQELLAVLASIGSQIGQFEKRTAAVDELQLRVNMLQSIPVAAWSVTPDGTPDIVNRLWYEYTG